MPDNTNDTPGLVRMTAKGTRLVWFTGWKSPISSKNQIWTLDINPTSLDAGFPQITSPAFNPNFLLQDGTSTTVMSANIADATDDNWFVGMLNGEVRSPLGGGIGRFRFEFFDDGADNDPLAGDGRF
jgi:hypothetical protein